MKSISIVSGVSAIWGMSSSGAIKQWFFSSEGGWLLEPILFQLLVRLQEVQTLWCRSSKCCLGLRFRNFLWSWLWNWLWNFLNYRPNFTNSFFLRWRVFTILPGETVIYQICFHFGDKIWFQKRFQIFIKKIKWLPGGKFWRNLIIWDFCVSELISYWRRKLLSFLFLILIPNVKWGFILFLYYVRYIYIYRCWFKRIPIGILEEIKN